VPSPGSSASQTRAIVLLAFASFASQSMVRVTDSLLPQIAADVGTTVGTASIVVTAYAITHGSMQLFIGPLATASASTAV
jgi:MFS transporter, YNFM family, putative membrane transport protein